MTLAEIGIAVGGVLSLAYAAFHFAFYRIFNWADEFKKIGKLNSAIFYTMNLFLVLLLLFFAYISFAHQQELAASAGLARTTIIFYAALWLFRAIWQVVYFKTSKKGRISPAMKIMRLVTMLWFLSLSAAYFTPLVFPHS
jgi:hypothetical protein